MGGHHARAARVADGAHGLPHGRRRDAPATGRGVDAQSTKSREQLEKDKVAIQARLKEFDVILKQTSATKKTSIGQLNAITSQFQSQNRLVNTLDREVGLLSNEILEIENEIAIENEIEDPWWVHVNVLFSLGLPLFTALHVWLENLAISSLKKQLILAGGVVVMGLLLFEMLEMEVWEKSKDSIGLTQFYDANKTAIYADKDLESNKGLIISDYQNYLEKMWVKGLHQKYKVEFKEEERKQLLEAKIDE